MFRYNTKPPIFSLLYMNAKMFKYIFAFNDKYKTFGFLWRYSFLKTVSDYVTNYNIY